MAELINTDEVIAVGEPVSEDDEMWQTAAEALAPDKSLQRVEDKAKFVVSTVAVVGSILTGLGLVAGANLGIAAKGHEWAVSAIVAAVVSIVLAVGSLLLGGDRYLSPGNLIAVQNWYTKQFRRQTPVLFSGLLLLCALALAGIAAFMSMTTTDIREPMMIAQFTSDGAKNTLVLKADYKNLRTGQSLSAKLSGVPDKGSPKLLAQQILKVGGDGTGSLSLNVESTAKYRYFRLVTMTENATCAVSLYPASGAPAINDQGFSCTSSDG
jgi:hypothetical protein